MNNECWYYLNSFSKSFINSDYLHKDFYTTNFKFGNLPIKHILNVDGLNWFSNYNLFPSHCFIFARNVNTPSTYHIDMDIVNGEPLNVHKCAINIELIGNGIMNFYDSTNKGNLLVDKDKNYVSLDFNQKDLKLIDSCEFLKPALVRTDKIHYVKSISNQRIVLSIRCKNIDNKYFVFDKMKNVLNKEIHR